MKTCPKCAIEKPATEFYRKTATQLQSMCKKCFNLYCAERWRQRKLDAIEHMGGECQDCHGTFHPAVFEFHHLHDKDLEWVKLRLHSWERILEELAKCALLCANCHRMRHVELALSN